MKVVIIGPFPPPVHGMSKNLKLFSDRCELRNDVVKINTSPGSLTKGIKYHCIKLIRFFFGVFNLLRTLVFHKVDYVYIPPDGGYGSYYSIFYVILCALFRVKCYLHHRSFAYINNYAFSYFLLNKLTNKNNFHFFLCDCMKERYEARYNVKVNSLVLNNIIHSPPILSNGNSKLHLNGTITIGFLSNVSDSKGIFRVIEIFKKLKDIGLNVELLIAGPFENKNVESLVFKSINGCEDVLYLGSLYGEEKSKFYEKVHFFCFPSIYKNEASPNVLFEATAHGCLLVTSDVGCIISDTKDLHGFFAKVDDEYINSASRYIASISESPNQFSILVKENQEVYSDKYSLALRAKRDFNELLNI